MRNLIYIPCKKNCCIKTSFVGSKIDRLCKHDECELKKMLNFCKQYKIFTAFVILYLNAEVGGLSMQLKIKKKNNFKIKTTKAKNKNKKIKDCRQAGNRTTIACVES